MEKRLREKKERVWDGRGSEGGLGPILSLRKASDVGVMPVHGHKARPVMVEVNGDGKAVQHNNIKKPAPKLIRIYCLILRM